MVKDRKTAQDNNLLEYLQQWMDGHSTEWNERVRISFQEMIDQFKQHNIVTYTQLCAFVNDEQAAPSLRDRAMYADMLLGFDNRRVITWLRRALQSPDDTVRVTAARRLCMSRSRRAVAPLIEIVLNKREAESLRNDAIYALGSIGDKRAAEPLRQIMLDTSESPLLRGEAIERSTYLAHSDRLGLTENYSALLSDAMPDVRFWALYALTTVEIETLDREKLLEKVDAIAAFDHAIPETFGWHVDREALLLLEQLYEHQFMASDEDTVTNFYLISPAPEYETLSHQYRKWREDWRYDLLPIPSVTLQVDPDWLAERLREHWSDVRLNVRVPKPQTYLLDWQLMIDGRFLSGGLHRDKYGVVIMGESGIPEVFARWYRSIISTDQPLYLYQWADEGILLE
jgi:hypothetical protein